MEFSAAERWTLLLNNLAYQKVPSSRLTAKALAWRVALKDLSGLQRQINYQLDEYNSRLKDGIWTNHASKLKSRNKSDEKQVAEDEESSKPKVRLDSQRNSKPAESRVAATN